MTDVSADLVKGTTIDPRSLLSTDYFNHFNEVIILFSMLPDMPEMLDEIDRWSFYNYKTHFELSSLNFASLAVELYDKVPDDLRIIFEKLVDQARLLIIESREKLRHLYEEGDMAKFAEEARLTTLNLTGVLDSASAVVHGHKGALDQESIDSLF